MTPPPPSRFRVTIFSRRLLGLISITSPFIPLLVMEGKQEKRDNYMQTSIYLYPGADPEIFEREGPEAIIYKILERVGPKSLKLAFECLFQSFSYKSFANIPPKGGGRGPWAPPLNPPLFIIWRPAMDLVSFSAAALYFCISRGRNSREKTQLHAG